MNLKGLIMALAGASALSLGEAQQLPIGWSQSATRDAAAGCSASAKRPWPVGENQLQIFCRLQTDGTMAITQSVSAGPYHRKRMQLSAQIQSDSVVGRAGLLMRVEADDQTTLAIDDMGTRPIKGTTAWTEHRVLLDVDSSAMSITFGVLLEGGPGAVLAKSVRFEEAPADSSELSIRLLPIRPPLPNQPQNLELR